MLGQVGADPSGNKLSLKVSRKEHQAIDICTIDLIHPAGEQLPSFKAGAHIDVYFENGKIRQYSLIGNPCDRHRYTIAVLREKGGRGCSVRLHDELHADDELLVGHPRNNFPLVTDPGIKHLLIAGGIGVTPMIAMIESLQNTGADFQMHYCAKSKEHTAFLDRLAGLIDDGRVLIHHDGGIPENGLNMEAALTPPPARTHVYFCGPAGFMSAVKHATRDWQNNTVHFEYFIPDPALGAESNADRQNDKAFSVRIASSGESITVRPDSTIVEALAARGVTVEVSCESGLCGTCAVKYLAGSIDHRDRVLEDEERTYLLTACCSRAIEGEIILDL